MIFCSRPSVKSSRVEDAEDELPFRFQTMYLGARQSHSRLDFEQEGNLCVLPNKGRGLAKYIQRGGFLLKGLGVAAQPRLPCCHTTNRGSCAGNGGGRCRLAA